MSADRNSWIGNGEKFAALALSVRVDNSVVTSQLPGDVSLLSNVIMPIYHHWREWLGSVAMDDLQNSNVVLLAKIQSQNPDVLDSENELLKRYVWNAFVGLSLSSSFATAHRPILITGYRENAVVMIRQHQQLQGIIPETVHP